MKAAVIDGVPDLTGIFALSLYETKPIHFISILLNSIKGVQKTRQVNEPKSDMVRYAQFLFLDVNDL